VEACDTHWLLGRYKAVAAGLGGAEMAEYFPVRSEPLCVDCFLLKLSFGLVRY
jgi:hypothetical protein